jgi:hypothetical protein
MKKLILSMAAIATLAASVASCKKTKDAINCVDAANKYQAASLAYFQSQTKANCEALKATLTDYLNSSCVPAEEKAALQENVRTLTCQ